MSTQLILNFFRLDIIALQVIVFFNYIRHPFLLLSIFLTLKYTYSVFQKGDFVRGGLLITAKKNITSILAVC